MRSITACIRSKAFWAFSQSLLLLQESVDNFRAWCEGCPCHDRVFEKKSWMQQQTILKRERGLKSSERSWECGCPLGGRRASELALGRHKKMLQSIAEASLLRLIAERQEQLSPPEVARIQDNYTRGLSHLQLYIVTKMASWETLPLSLAGMSHIDKTQACKL